MPRHKKIDFLLLLPVLVLLIFSIAIIASVVPANLASHFTYFLVALLFFFLFTFLDIEIFYPFAPLIYLFCVFLLILPFFIGTVTRGSVRWIPIGNYTLQPSEIMKPFLVLLSSWFWAKRNFNWRSFLVYLSMFLPSFILIFFQPDLGSALVTLSIFLGVMLFSGINKKSLLVMILILVLSLPLSWFALRDYQKLRVLHLINPYSDPYGEGYNVIQAKITIGSGGIFGRGLGRGTQSHLAFLPERHTDFVFASLGEELGFTGTLVVLFCYLFFFLRILKITKAAKEKDYFLLCIGLFFYFTFQSIVNIGMNFGLLPITGIPLPFLSFGGSAFLTNMIGLGMLQCVYRHQQEKKVFVIR